MNAMMMRIPVATIILALSCWSVIGFAPSSISRHASVSSIAAPTSTICLNAGGFGGGGGGGMGKKAGGDKKKKKSVSKEIKLKPKQQWDRYAEFKREPKIQVGVRIKDDDEWLAVGRVKSKDSEYTEAAVFRQRAIIAEHAKRLFPIQLSSKKTLEWGYHTGDEETNEWKIVDKSCMSTEVDGLEKLIGFEGRPDPASGFYCVYDGGRLKLGEESSFN